MWQMESQQLQLKAPKLQLNHQRATGPPADPSCEALWGAMSRFAVPSSRRVLAAAHSKDLLQSSDPTGCQLNKAGQAPSSFSIAAKPFVPVWLACKQPQSSVPPSYDYSGVLQAGETFGESATVGTASPALTSQSARRVTANAAPPALNCHAAVTDLHQAASDSMQLWPSFSKTWAEDDTAEDEEAGPGGPSSSHPDLWDSASSAQGDHEALNDGALEDGALHETALDEGALHDVPNKHDQQKPSTANHAEVRLLSWTNSTSQKHSVMPLHPDQEDSVHLCTDVLVDLSSMMCACLLTCVPSCRPLLPAWKAQLQVLFRSRLPVRHQVLLKTRMMYILPRYCSNSHNPQHS